MFAQKDCNNTTTQQINNPEKLLTKIDKNSNKILVMYLDMYIIYIKYLNQVNKVAK